jgi:LysR family transcriptional regulator, glycine cleavage system transcriptional activator
MSKTHNAPTRKRVRLPPLGALRAFEAVARHGSMSRAARELNVTQGAVSRQVALLQATLHMKLVVRTGRGIVLTDLGQRLFTGIKASFERLRDTIDELAADAGGSTVSITTLPTVATRWLIPRVNSFQESNPDITLDVRSTAALADLALPTFDLAIRYGEGRWPAVRAQLLFEVKHFPVCSPAFLEKHGPIRAPLDLEKLPLIHKVSRQWWLDWMHAVGISSARLRGGIIVDEYELAIQLALDGQGIALARDALIGQELANGSLQRVFDASVALPRAFYLCHAEARPLSQAARRVFDWLVDAGRKQGIDGSSG